jgi:hypothetical protein
MFINDTLKTISCGHRGVIDISLHDFLKLISIKALLE